MSILKFKEFLNEQEELVIDVQPDVALQNLDGLNSDLDGVTENPFMNSAIFMNAVRGTLERYGILLPPSYVVPTLSAEAETVYTLGESGYYLYMCHNQNKDSLIEGYAQVVDEDELNDLVDMDKLAAEEDELENEYSTRKTRNPYPAARRDDDSGNDSEYA
jgi:hypothetical protein